MIFKGILANIRYAETLTEIKRKANKVTMPTHHQIHNSDKMFTLNKRTDGNETYHLLPVAINDYVTARFALFNWAHTSAHQLISQSIEKFIKLFLKIHKGNFPHSHNHRELLEKNEDIDLFKKILANSNYMELLDELIDEKFIETRYGENYISAKFPILLDTLDSLVRDFLAEIPHGPKFHKIGVHERYKDIFLRDNKFFNESEIHTIKL